MARRLLLGLATLAAFACAGASAAAHPTRGVLVYAKAASSSPNAPESVWTAHVDGSDRRMLAAGADPTVSPDGGWIAFDDGPQILVMPTAGGTPSVLYTLHGRWPSLANAPVWAPDSRRFAVIDGAGQLLVLDRASAGAKAVAHADGLAFSPDSRRIVYEAHGGLYVIPASGGEARRITHGRNDSAPVWGGPGIAFARLARGGKGDIWLLRSPAAHPRRLTHTGSGFYPAFFSADGTRLLAANPALHNGRLWAVDVRTGAARPLTPWVGDLVPQGLSGNGRTVLAAVGCGGMVGPLGYVETIPFAGGKPHVLVRGPCRASWS